MKGMGSPNGGDRIEVPRRQRRKNVNSLDYLRSEPEPRRPGAVEVLWVGPRVSSCILDNRHGDDAPSREPRRQVGDYCRIVRSHIGRLAGIGAEIKEGRRHV